LLLAAAHETGLLGTLGRACLTPDAPGSLSSSRSLLLTLFFLNAVGLRRTWDLRGYTGDGLALLTGRRHAYGYRHIERFLSTLAQAGGAEPLTDALALWTATLWWALLRTADVPPPTFYIDGHRKPVYADGLIPRGLVGRRGAVLGCRALLVLHDTDGRPLLATTHRGDTHLTAGAGRLLDRFERAAGLRRGQRVVVDREGLAATFLRDLTAEGRTVVTVLRADQYADLDSFTDIGPFVPLRYDRRGTLTREVAPARFTLTVPDEPAERLEVRVALIRDLIRRVVRPTPAEPRLAWDFSYDVEDRPWWEVGWAATSAPATPTAPKLVPIVTTAADVDPVELARTYSRRWVAQENSFKDWLIPLGLDVNHGYAAVPVVNSEVGKRRMALEKRLDNVRRWAERARVTHERASKRYTKRWKAAKAHREELYRALNLRIWALEERYDLLPQELRAQIRGLKDAAKEEMEGIYDRMDRARYESDAAYHKQERYCVEQRALLRQLEDLAIGERAMRELDNGKDQIMTAMKVALVNLAMHTRDRYFGGDYQHATWCRLAPFFRLPGRVVQGPDTVHVELRPFNDRQFNRDLVALCAKVDELRPCLPDGRRLVFAVSGARSLSLNAQRSRIA